MSVRLIPVVVAVAAIAAACSKSEPPPASKAPATADASATPAAPKASSREVDAATQERLARQEAAARLFEKNVLERPASRTPPPPPAAAVQPPVQKTAPSVAAPSVAAPPSTVAPAKVETQSPAPVPKAEPAKPSPPPVQQPPAAEPRTDVAAARPAPAPAPAGPRLVSRIDPEFPREALQAGVEQGRVTARMTLDATGNVTRVEILDASPRRVFDRAVIRALSQWRYTEGAAGRTVEMEVAFALGKR